MAQLQVEEKELFFKNLAALGWERAEDSNFRFGH